LEMTERQKEITAASVGLIADGGIQGLTIRALAERVGVSEAAIYRHFGSKFDILSAILRSFEEASSGVLDGALSVAGDSGALDGIGAFFVDRCARLSRDPKLAKVVFSEENFQDDSRLAERVLKIMHSHRAAISELIEDGVERREVRGDIDPVSLFRIIFGPLRLLVKQWCLSGFAFDLEREGRALWADIRKLLETCEQKEKKR